MCKRVIKFCVIISFQYERTDEKAPADNWDLVQFAAI